MFKKLHIQSWAFIGFSALAGLLGGAAPAAAVPHGMALVVHTDGVVVLRKLDNLNHALSDLLLNQTLDELHRVQQLATDTDAEMMRLCACAQLKRDRDRVRATAARQALARCVAQLEVLIKKCKNGEDAFNTKIASALRLNLNNPAQLYRGLVAALSVLRIALMQQLDAARLISARKN
jgi:hypothetical protein